MVSSTFFAYCQGFSTKHLEIELVPSYKKLFKETPKLNLNILLITWFYIL